MTTLTASHPPALHGVPRQVRAVSGSLTVAVDAEQHTVLAALDRVDLAGAIGSLDIPGQVEVRWDVQVQPAGDGASFLSIATRFSATGDDSYARLLDAWGRLGPLSRSVARRAAGAVKALAEADHESESEIAA